MTHLFCQSSQHEPKWNALLRHKIHNFAKNQLAMNNFKKLLLNLPCRYNLTADILRKQPRFVPSENLDNSQYVGMRAEVVRPIVYYSARPIHLGRTTLYTYRCELISFFYIRAVQSLRMKNERGSHLSLCLEI